MLTFASRPGLRATTHTSSSASASRSTSRPAPSRRSSTGGALRRYAPGSGPVGGGAEPGDDTGDRRPHVGPVVDERVGQAEGVRPLPDGEPRERFRGSETVARAADEQDARQPIDAVAIGVGHGSGFSSAAAD